MDIYIGLSYIISKGGDRTREEMCLSILMYYPALPTRMVCTGDVHPLDQLQAVHPEITG